MECVNENEKFPETLKKSVKRGENPAAIHRKDNEIPKIFHFKIGTRKNVRFMTMMHSALAEKLQKTIDAVHPIAPEWLERAALRQDQLVKPRGSLGRLEDLANRAAAIQRTERPTARPRDILVFCADHGVCAEGVNAYPQSVTWQHMLNFLGGGAAIHVLAKLADAETQFIDVGVAHDFAEPSALHNRKIRPGTRNFAVEPAMTRDETLRAILVGVEMAEASLARGRRMIGIGEMGIGNTTAAAAITAVLTHVALETAVGPGSGLSSEGVLKKASVIARAVRLHRPDSEDALDIIDKIGGLEIAAMCGAFLACAAGKTLAVADGFISTAAAALAMRLAPAAGDYIVASHLSAEIGHRALCERFALHPLLELNLRLGEASGAALAFPMIDAALSLFSDMKTFSEAGVSDR